MKIATILPLAAVMVIAAGCTHYNRRAQYGYETDPHGREVISSPGYSTGHRTSRQALEMQRRADQDLVVSLRDQFEQYGYLDDVARNVDVTARNGTVTLSGLVPTRKDRDMIDAMVRNTRGVASVNNQLQVSEATGVLQPTGRPGDSAYVLNPGENFNLHVQGLNETDRQLAQRILHELRRDPTLDRSFPKVDIHVANGYVTVRGGVEDEHQKQVIASAVERAAGAPVRNELRVRPRVR